MCSHISIAEEANERAHCTVPQARISSLTTKVHSGVRIKVWYSDPCRISLWTMRLILAP